MELVVYADTQPGSGPDGFADRNLQLFHVKEDMERRACREEQRHDEPRVRKEQ